MLFDHVADPLEQDNLAGTPRTGAVEDNIRLRILAHLLRTQVHATYRHCQSTRRLAAVGSVAAAICQRVAEWFHPR